MKLVNVDNEEEQELFLDEGLEEEQNMTILEEAADIEDGPTTKPNGNSVLLDTH